MDPRDRVALITGGARMGREVAESLARRGCHVALTCLKSQAEAEDAAGRVRSHGVSAIVVQADLADPSTPGDVVDRVLSDLGRLDILICMASLYRRTPFESLDEAAWRANIDVDLKSVYLLALAAAPRMKKRGGGRIIAFADWLPVSGRPRYHGWVPYYVAKSGIVGLTQSLALELAPDVLVNAIAPGPILKPTGFTAEANREVIDATPLGRWGGPSEIAKAVNFLIDSDFVTGECIRVDGGRHLN